MKSTERAASPLLDTTALPITGQDYKNLACPVLIRRIAVLYPSGNTTAVVFDDLKNVNRQTLNQSIMSAWKGLTPAMPSIEQCCFIILDPRPGVRAKVDMFGGEFCGNAARVAVWLATNGQDQTGFIEVSGQTSPLRFEVNGSQVRLVMPLPESRTFTQSVPEGMLVRLTGISQLVVTVPQGSQTPRQLLTDIVQTNRYNLASQPAVGISYYDRSSRTSRFCVWVQAVDTIFDETACGSGTCAIGIAETMRLNRSVAMSIIQPSGETIQTTCVYASGTIVSSDISGEVATLYDGELQLS